MATVNTYNKKFLGDPKIFGRVAVLFGGTSAEREISLKSGKAVLAALLELGVDAVGIDLGDDAVKQLAGVECDRVFIALHGAGGEDGKVQALLEWLSLRYTGSGVEASSTAMNKVSTKLMFQGAGLPTPDFTLLNDASDFEAVLQSLGGKGFVKPASEGSSIGMRPVSTGEELKEAYHFAATYDSNVFVEKTIEGREFSVAVLNGQALPSIELKVKNEFYDFDAKYVSDETEYVCPSEVSEDEEALLSKLATSAFKVLGCSGWGRIDFMRDVDGHFYLLEANTVPGMTNLSLVPMAARAVGLEFRELLAEILMPTLEAENAD